MAPLWLLNGFKYKFLFSINVPSVIKVGSVPQVKVVMLLSFVVHLNALHLKLMLVQRMLQQNVVMCLTLTP